MNKEDRPITIEKELERIKAQMNAENESIGLPPGLYHHIILSDGSRSVELSTPAQNISFDNFVDMGMYLMLFTQNEDMRKIMKAEFTKHWEGREVKHE